MRITRDGDSISATSTGGMATAILEPRDPPNIPEPTRSPVSQPTLQQSGPTTALRIPDSQGNPRRSGSFHFTWLHGLHVAPLPVADENADPEILSDDEKSTFSINDGETKEYGRVSFSCTGPDCEVQVHRLGVHDFNVTYTGNVTATVLPFDAEKMWNSSWGGQSFCLNDSPGDCTFPSLVLDNARILNSYPRTAINSKEILFEGTVPFILTEDKKTRIASNYGWQGKRYVNNTDGSTTLRDIRIEKIIYTNAANLGDTDYLSYGRSMIISGASWMPSAVYTKSSGSTYGLGDLTGKVTYMGGATGWYALTSALTGGDADAGYFTARTTLNADLNSDLTSNDNLLIEGTIDQFVDEDGVERDWSVVLQSNNFKDRSGARINIDTPKRTVWTIREDTAAPSERWEGYAAEEGNSIHGAFYATHGTDGRLSGAFGAKRSQ